MPPCTVFIVNHSDDEYVLHDPRAAAAPGPGAAIAVPVCDGEEEDDDDVEEDDAIIEEVQDEYAVSYGVQARKLWCRGASGVAFVQEIKAILATNGGVATNVGGIATAERPRRVAASCPPAS